MICLRLFHLVPWSHQISKPNGGGAGQELEVPRHKSCCQCPTCPYWPWLCAPKRGRRVGVHEGALLLTQACWFTLYLAYPTPWLLSLEALVLHSSGFPCSPCSPATLQHPALRRQGQCSLPGREQQGVELEFCQCCWNKWIHLWAYGGIFTERGSCCCLLAKFLVFMEYLHVVYLRFLFSLGLLAVAGWRSAAGGGRGYPAHRLHHAGMLF